MSMISITLKIFISLKALVIHFYISLNLNNKIILTLYDKVNLFKIFIKLDYIKGGMKVTTFKLILNELKKQDN
jgi:hypothetical protein